MATFLFHQLLHPIVFDRLLFERVRAPLLPLAGVGVVAALEGFRVDVFRVFEVGTAIGADIAELAVFAHRYLVFGDVPVFFEAGLFEGFPQGSVPDIAVALFHAGAVFDVALGVYGDFAVEAGVVVLGFSERRQIDGKIVRRSNSAVGTAVIYTS